MVQHVHTNRNSVQALLRAVSKDLGTAGRRGFVVLAMLFATNAFAQWHVNVLWQRQGLQDSSGYGALILPLGDQNNDGYADWAVCAAAPYSAGEADSSYLEFFHGGNPPDTVPYMTYTPVMTNNGYFGGAWAIGDVNGDGYQDWMVRVAYLNPYGYFEAQIFFGGPGPHTVPDARWHFHWETDDEQFFSIGDFNGDGFADLYKWRRNGDVGFACFGGAAFDTIPDWVRHSPPDSSYQSYPQGHGDINRDGFDDFVSATWQPEPRLYVYRGSTHPDTMPAQVLPLPGHTINMWLNVVNDLNGDGRSDVLVMDLNALAVFFGRDTLRSIPDVTLSFPFGIVTESTSLGDVNGDGYGDFAAVNLNGDIGNGVLALYLGNYQMASQPAWVLDGRGGPPYLVGIRWVVGVGDINGDGINDIAIGATNEDNDGIRGKAVIISGDTSVHVAADNPRAPVPDLLRVSVYPNPFNSISVISLSLPSAAQVSLEVFDLLGRAVWTKDLRRLGAGEHREVFDARGMASGVYYARVRAGTVSETRKIMLMR